MTPVAQLRAVRARLTPPGAWLPRSFSAQDAAGRVVQCRSRDAVAWGILGALVAVVKPDEPRERALAALRAVTKARHLCDWEEADGRTQAEVLDALDRAVAWLGDADRLDDAA